MSPELGDGTNHCRWLLARRREFEFGGKHFSLEELVCKKMSRKPKDKESVNEENKQFDPGGKEGEPPL